jgi:hypothetical protein
VIGKLNAEMIEFARADVVERLAQWASKSSAARRKNSRA